MIGAFPVWLWIFIGACLLMVAFVAGVILLDKWLARRDDKTSRHGSRREARARRRLRDYRRRLPATIRLHRDLTDEEQEWADVLDDITAEQARNRQYPVVTSSPATAPIPSPPAGDAPGPVRATPQGAESSRVPFAAAAAGPGAPWLPAPIPHQGPWQGHAELQVHHDEYAPPMVWESLPHPRAVRAPGALMSPLLPAVVVLRAVILTAEPAATKPAVWEHDTAWFAAIEADAAKADAS